MKSLTASILALGLAASIGTASAQQSPGYYSADVPSGSYRPGDVAGGYDDYARVLRVDPAYDTAYADPGNGQRCTSRQDTYADNGYPASGAYGNGYPNAYGAGAYPSQGTTAGRTVATVIGGVLGAALGSQVGGGSARYATAAVGSMVGGIAGQRVYENAQRNRYPRTGTVVVCDPEQVDRYGQPTSYPAYSQGSYSGVDNRRVSGYDVTYEYAGRTYTTRMAYDPGSRLRVRVDVRPE